MDQKNNNRRQKGRWAGIPHRVIESGSYSRLDGWDVKLLLELAKQYNGRNNGDLSATFSQSKELGWRSSGTLSGAIKKLLRYGFIQKTRQGGKNRCCLYALTWAAIDECKGKLEVGPTKTPSNLWQVAQED